MSVKYTVDRFFDSDQYQEMQYWCHDHFGDTWKVDFAIERYDCFQFEFADEKDALLFILRWGRPDGVYES